MKIVRYFLVGAIAAAVDIGTFTYFTICLGLYWLPVSVFSFILATLINYFLSIRYVFQSGLKYKRSHELMGVFIVSSFALLVNQITLYILIEQLAFGLILAKFSATGIVFLWNYFGRSRYVFSS